MSIPPTSFVLVFPLVVDSLFYGVYSVLFLLSVYVLCTGRRPLFKFHLACMVALFALSTAHITLVYTLAFLSDFGVSAPYEIFSLRAQGPTLFPDGDPHGNLDRMAQSVRILYGLSNAVADALIIYRCYVIWAYKWKIVLLPILAWCASLLVTVFGAAGQGNRAVIIAAATSLFTNIIAASLAAGRIWWIGRQARAMLGKDVQIKYRASFAILLESGLLYPAVLLLAVVFFIAPVAAVGTLSFLAMSYQLVGIAPTLIIVRVGLGVSTETVDQTVSTLVAAGGKNSHSQSRGLGMDTYRRRRRDSESEV